MIKSKYFFVLTAAVACLTFAGCATATKTGEDGTLVTVRTVDPVRVKQIREIVEPGAASVLRRAIKRSPEHAQMIADYAGAVAGIFCQMESTGNFSVDFLIAAADKATADLQAKATGNDDWVEEIIDGKAVLIGIYKAAVDQQLTWKLPDNVWLREVSALVCNSVTQALHDARR